MFEGLRSSSLALQWNLLLVVCRRFMSDPNRLMLPSFLLPCDSALTVSLLCPLGINYSSYDSAGYTSTSTPSYYQPPQQNLTQLQPPPQQLQPQPPPQPQPQPSIQAPPKQLTSSSWSNSGSNMVTAPAVNTYKKPTFHQNKLQKPKGPPKQPQLHYCDICKISCAGPQVGDLMYFIVLL